LSSSQHVVYFAVKHIPYVVPVKLSVVVGLESIEIYKNAPVIHKRTIVNLKSGWVGVLTPEHGAIATAAAGQLLEGSTRIVVYGEDVHPSRAIK